MNQDGAQSSQPARGPGPSGNAVPSRYVLIVGFGLSGRTTAETVEKQGIDYAVIETNAETVARCTKAHRKIILGDARDPAVLRQAEIERATDVAVTVPSDQITLDVVEQARKLNATARIVARCTFVSGGMEATRRGADDVVIAEQVVATEFGAVMTASLERKS